MKILKISFILLFNCFINGYAQNCVLYDVIQEAKSSGEQFDAFSVLTTANRSVVLNGMIQENFINPHEVYTLNFSNFSPRILNSSMTLFVPLGDKNLQLELQEYKMEYQVTTSDGQTIHQNKNIRHYHGIVKYEPQSVVAITFGENEIIGLVSTNEGNFNIALEKQSGEHIFYNEKNLKQKSGFICGTNFDDGFEGYDPEILFKNSRISLGSLSSKNLESRSNSSVKTVQLYFETTFDIFQARGNNVGNVETFITGLFNQVAVLYRNESINTSISQIHVWNTQDPFANIILTNNGQNNLDDYIRMFQSVRTSFNGNLGQLVTFRNLGVTLLGGLAASSNGLCNNNIRESLSVAQIANVNFPNVPNYSESVFV